MEAGSETDKKWDFTIDSVQCQKLTTTKFKHGNLVLGILEVVWGWWKWLLESRKGQKLVCNCLWVFTVKHGWTTYKLTRPEWQIIKLAHKCLKVLSSTHGDLWGEKFLTCNRVFPLLKKLQTTWEALSVKHEYQPVQNALLAGLQNMDKWYLKTDDTSIYFVSHGIVFSWGSFSVTDKSTSWPPSSWSSIQTHLSWDILGWRVGHPRYSSHEDHSKLLNTSCRDFSDSL